MSFLEALNTVSKSASMIKRAMQLDVTLKQDIKDCITEESMKAGLQTGRLYTAIINDWNKVSHTLTMLAHEARMIKHSLDNIKRDIQGYRDGHIVNTIESIRDELSKPSEKAIKVGEKLEFLANEVDEDRVIEAFIKEANGSHVAMNIICEKIGEQLSVLRADARECQYYNRDRVDFLEWRYRCALNAKIRLRSQESENNL